MVRQELNGLFLAHYGIRSFMTEAADIVDIDPRPHHSPALHIVRRRITDPAGLSLSARLRWGARLGRTHNRG